MDHTLPSCARMMIITFIHDFLFMHDGARPRRTKDNFNFSTNIYMEVLHMNFADATGLRIDLPTYSPDLKHLNYGAT